MVILSTLTFEQAHLLTVSALPLRGWSTCSRSILHLPAALCHWANMSTLARAFTALAIVLSVLFFALTVALQLSISDAVFSNSTSREFLCVLLGSLCWASRWPDFTQVLQVSVQSTSPLLVLWVSSLPHVPSQPAKVVQVRPRRFLA